MDEYQFTLVISGSVERAETLDGLFEAGCDDATFGTIDGVSYGDFVRRAPSFGEALRSAIDAVESVSVTPYARGPTLTRS